MNNSLLCLYNNAPKVSIYIYYVSSYVIITTSKYYIYPLFEKLNIILHVICVKSICKSSL